MRFSLLASLFLTTVLVALVVCPLNVGGDNSFLLFLGRFHPLVLHVPIGVLTVLFFLELLHGLLPRLKLGSACQILLWFAALSALPAVVAGFLLASSGGYNEVLLDRHQWLGWGTALLCAWLIPFRQWQQNRESGGLLGYRILLFVNVCLLSLAGHYGGSLTHGSDYLTKYMPLEWKARLGVEMTEAEAIVAEIRLQDADEVSEEALGFADHVQPIVDKYCYECHGSAKQKGEVRMDIWNWDMINGPDAEGWHSALDMINQGEMPPKDNAQLADTERRLLVDWITASLDKAADAKLADNQGVIRRLTKQQYTNSLNELLGVSVNFGEVLPDDGKSKMGFSNNGEVLQISPLHFDYYQQIARDALDKAIVFGEKPEPKRYKVTLGENIGKGAPGAVFGGFQTVPVRKEHFLVDLLDVSGDPKLGGDDASTAEIKEIKKHIGVGLRGSANGRYGMTESGMTLYSALPHKYVPPRSWQGPSPNMKMIIKDHFPQAGDFVFRVEAARGEALKESEGLLSLRKKVPSVLSDETIYLSAADAKNLSNLELKDDRWLLPIDVAKFTNANLTLEIPKAGFYQLDLFHPYAPVDSMPAYRLAIGKLGRAEERLKLDDSLAGAEHIVTPMSLAYFKKGQYSMTIGGRFFVGFSQITVTPLPAGNKMSEKMAKEAKQNEDQFKHTNPSIRAYAGGRTDDGMDYKAFDVAQEVTTAVGEFKTYSFKGRLENLPIPIFDPSAKTVHANSMVVGLWNDYLVKNKGSSGPPLLVRSMEIEAPYYDVWPPKSHTDIFIESENKANLEQYTREVLQRFIERAYRRPVADDELDRYMDFWRSGQGDFDRYEDSVKEVLVSVLCNPNFLYLPEPNLEGDDAIESQYALATKLAYFLWNSPPDDELTRLAASGQLEQSLPQQISRMVADPKVWRMIRAFTYEWLRVDRQVSTDTNVNQFSDYSRFVKEDMPEETYHFIHHVLNANLSIMNFIDSDFAMLNQNLAEFYKIKGVQGSEFRPVPITEDMHRGGLLSQGAFLNGHSDGSQGHPIKRAVWLKEKILGDPAPPPPPNVPELDPDTPGFDQMTLKEQLELHRNKASCVDCHAKIDPYGVAFENFDAVGRFRTEVKGKPVDASVVLPDGTEVHGIRGMQDYILTSKQSDVTQSVVEHLFAYALGRDVSFVDEKEIQQIVDKVTADEFRFQSVIENIVLSRSFLNHSKKENL